MDEIVTLKAEAFELLTRRDHINQRLRVVMERIKELEAEPVNQNGHEDVKPRRSGKNRHLGGPTSPIGLYNRMNKWLAKKHGKVVNGLDRSEYEMYRAEFIQENDGKSYRGKVDRLIPQMFMSWESSQRVT